ncbi:hypothetical protein QFC20_002830 [Naganishia adeliensis]|uniref:Uncharacterized protein n=1 Tax=Naganishia adeliensis TaxID=92952 RepID=A0ACC2WHY9_9TREE|nr:hypothetical protein QFC20_002830 [Naganishia adeliensis]
MPRRGGPPKKSKIPGVKHVVAVASGKGGVGKSTIAGASLGAPSSMDPWRLIIRLDWHSLANLALAISNLSIPSADGAPRNPRVGLLDLDIFGPSVPKLMGLENAGEPLLSESPSANNDNPVVWRGLMVMKAVQQLLFDVDWRDQAGDLDVLVIDMPPGTGDVQLSLGQLVIVDGAVIVSTPQDVALIDARKGVNMFRKINIPIIGAVLNQSHFTCSCCNTRHELFGSPASFNSIAEDMSLDVLGEIPLVPSVSSGGDRGVPVVAQSGKEGEEIRGVMASVAQHVWRTIQGR